MAPSKPSMRTAVTVIGTFPTKLHGPVPLQPPDQPLKTDPDDGVAVRVTSFAVGKVDEQVVPQSTPAGLLVTVPAPVPALVKVSVKPPPEGLPQAVLEKSDVSAPETANTR